jgi:serpin B
LPEGAVSPETKLVLVNTIWLKAKWLFPFDPVNTKDEIFHTTDKDLKVPFMHNTRDVSYAEDETMQTIELPYKSQKISMLVFLPVKGNENEFAQKIDAGQFTKWIDNMKMQKIIISLPKFKLNSSFDLNEMLKQSGMSTAFSNTADFSGISQTHLEISDVIHKAFIEVGEEGTEAAAATALTVMTRSISVPPASAKVFKADRPFVFFLYDKEAKTILFMGKMEKP